MAKFPGGEVLRRGFAVQQNMPYSVPAWLFGSKIGVAEPNGGRAYAANELVAWFDCAIVLSLASLMPSHGWHAVLQGKQ